MDGQKGSEKVSPRQPQPAWRQSGGRGRRGQMGMQGPALELGQGTWVSS